ncbi:hypothetical protein P9H08_22170 [Bacillus cereus]|uniref:hypothetical protein n=1 Tax=Bacillus TaxID=1386 RepID=UPI000B60EB37|nr:MULTISPECIES: hypothetical protein [Bacillus]ASL62793.1 hypothetical protein FORC47_p441 [Bacillus cereus]MEC2259326.1 hypothetical protein [Bacillus cereus]MED3313606.1 hypothetical protein [Bacillus thuringiensis]
MLEPKKVVTSERYARYLHSAIHKLEKPGKSEIMPLVIPKSMVTDDFTYIKRGIEGVLVYVKSISKEAQNLFNERKDK